VSDGAFRKALERAAPEYGLHPDSAVLVRFEAHYRLLTVWNRKLNLTRVIEPEDAARFHFLESAMLTGLVAPPAGRLVDIGSGAGFPGLAMASVWDSIPTVLVEPIGKRCVFLKEAVRATGLGGVTVENARFDAASIRPGDLVVTRALDNLSGLLDPIVSSAAAQIALFTDPEMIERARRLAPERTCVAHAIPGTTQRMIGVLTKQDR